MILPKFGSKVDSNWILTADYADNTDEKRDACRI